MKKAKRKKSGVWKAIIVVVVLLLVAIGVLFFVLYQRNSEIKEIQASEEAKKQDYTTLVTSAALPEGWDQSTLDTLQSNALAAYDTSFATTIDSALSGNEDAITEVLEKKESTQPDAVAEYTTLFTNLNTYPAVLGKLAANDASNLPLVLSYSGSSSTGEEANKLSNNLEEGIPSLKDANPAWAFMPYGNGLMATDGSAPTCISMVFSYALQDPEITPVFIAKWATEYGYDKTPISATDSIFSAAAWTWGVNMTPLNSNPTYVNDSLDMGGHVIVQLGNEESNKFVLVVSKNEDGTWKVYDPTVTEESTTVDPESYRDQMMSAYSYWWN